jgi:hypothetical protein
MSRAKRPKVMVRNGNDELNSTTKIVEACASNGTGLLIGVSTTADEAVLYVTPYRADRDVYLFIKRAHADDCAVMTSSSPDRRRCDCGACYTYDAAAREWRPTTKRAAPAFDARPDFIRAADESRARGGR